MNVKYNNMCTRITTLVRSISLFSVLIAALSLATSAQSPPNNLNIDEENHLMELEGLNTSSFYDEDILESIYLEFEQSDFWQQLHDSYDTENYVQGTLRYKDEVLENIGAQFKGNTSYRNVSNDAKYSFDISLDEFVDGQDIDGYNTLNLNNAFDDPSFMREVLYCHLNRHNIPSAKGNFVKLYINGEYWGIYANIQQLNKDFTKEWFMTNNGSLWRADAPSSTETKSISEGRPPGGGGGTPKWGDGTSALNYLGNDISLYQEYYTLKHSSQDNPWDLLLQLTDVLNNTSDDNLLAELSKYLDVDKTLWFLAHETVFVDDDSYIMKGRQDYYVYFEPETELFTPLEFDGNSALSTKNINWGLFYNEDNVNYPLMNRLYAIPEIRQRYLAHARSIINELLDVDYTDSLVNKYDALIRNSVESDTKNMNTFNQYLTSVDQLKSFIGDRKDILLANTEVSATALTIASVQQKVNDVLFATPSSNELVNITATITGSKDVNKAILYYSSYYVGSFTKTEMFDDGMHQDGAAGDGIYGGEIPAFPSGEYVRYYIEAIADDEAKTASYSPIGAEHDVYYYKVELEESENSDLVINEFMAANDKTIADNEGEFDDWLELYNKSGYDLDISGYFLSDKADELKQWEFPTGTTIAAGAYLLVWADNDESQEGLHTNFKLSAGGEELYLSDNTGLILDKVSFGEQEDDVSTGRLPNGTGDFKELTPSPLANNQFLVNAAIIANNESQLNIYPNPATNSITFDHDKSIENISVYTIQGVKVLELNPGTKRTQLNTSQLTTGIYYISLTNDLGEQLSRKIVVKK